MTCSKCVTQVAYHQRFQVAYHLQAPNEIKYIKTKRNIRNTSKQENKSISEKDKPQRIHPQLEATRTRRPSKVNTIVPQLSKCLKFEAIRGDQTDQMICILTKR